MDSQNKNSKFKGGKMKKVLRSAVIKIKIYLLNREANILLSRLR